MAAFVSRVVCQQGVVINREQRANGCLCNITTGSLQLLARVHAVWSRANTEHLMPAHWLLNQKSELLHDYKSITVTLTTNP
jgi:hypothetical protein